MEDFTLKKLKAELRKRGAKTTGRKKELVERLQAYERNSDFGVSHTDEEDYVMTTPAEATYEDLVLKDTLKLSKEQVLLYLVGLDVSIEKKHKHLYDCHHLKRVKLSAAANETYIQGAFKAEMRKSTSYVINVKLSKEGDIVETECECAAGTGPKAHCKHIVALLYGLTCFIDTGKFTLSQSCTSKLQTFHHPSREYTGKPLEAENLPLGAMANPLFDPRPSKYRKMSGYADYVKNLTINFVNTTHTRMPIQQIIQPANPYALNNDHDYGLVSLNQQRITTINRITPFEAQQLEAKTKKQALSPIWNEARRTRLTSSKFGLICKRQTNFEKLADSLMHPPKLHCPSVQHGKVYESKAKEILAERLGKEIKDSGVVVNPAHNFLAASPDGTVDSSTLVEIKCPYSARDKPINQATVPYLTRGTDDQLQLKNNHDYFYQVQGQMLVAEATSCIFCVYTHVDIVHFRIAKDEIFINTMLDQLNNFYLKYYCDILIERYFNRDYEALVCQHKQV